MQVAQVTNNLQKLVCLFIQVKNKVQKNKIKIGNKNMHSNEHYSVQGNKTIF